MTATFMPKYAGIVESGKAHAAVAHASERPALVRVNKAAIFQ